MKVRLTFIQALKRTIFLLLMLLGFVTHAQERGVQLEHNLTHKKVFYPENTRVKLKTSEGKKFVGYYSIIDDKTISINGSLILLNDIVKLKKRSKEGSIMRPVLFAFGAVCITGAVAGAAAGGYGYVVTALLLPTGVFTVLPVLLPNDHKSDRWKYSIVTKTANPEK